MNKKILILLLVILAYMVGFFAVKAFYVPQEDSRTVITVGYENANSMKMYEEEFEKQNPDIDVRLVSYSYYMQFFNAKAINNTHPIYFQTWYSEFDKMMRNGYIADITDYVDSEEFLSKINPDIKEVAVRDGRIYAIPTASYAMGMIVNEKLFRQAGLVDGYGNILIPESFDDVWEYVKTIKNNTGEKGIMIRYDGYNTGWYIVNIAWNYGVEFIKEENGKYKACFDDERLIDIFRTLYDLRWNYDAIYYNMQVNKQGLPVPSEVEAGMCFFAFESDCGIRYKSDGDSVYIKIPAGAGGRYALTGGKIGVISSSATEEQIKACIKWAEYMNELPGEENKLKEEQREKEAIEARDNQNVFIRAPGIWKKSNDKIEKLIKKYDIGDEKAKHYNDYSGVTLKTEVPVNCQQLYNILSGCFEKTMTDSDVDIPKMIKEANEKFEKEYLN